MLPRRPSSVPLFSAFFSPGTSIAAPASQLPSITLVPTGSHGCCSLLRLMFGLIKGLVATSGGGSAAPPGCGCLIICSVLRSRAIKTNQDLLPETPWTNILYDDFWGTVLTHSGSHKSFRPLCTLSFRLNYALHGLRPRGYHLLNLALHALVTALFTALARPLLGRGAWSLLAGLLFASHPVHTEAVAGVVGRADVGAALFFLLSLFCHARHCGLRRDARARPAGRRRWAWMLGGLGCAAASMLWKEQGVTVLAVSAVYDLFVFQRLRLHQVLPLLLGKVNEWVGGASQTHIAEC